MIKFKFYRTLIKIKKAVTFSDYLDNDIDDLEIQDNNDNHYIINVALPGVNKQDVNVVLKKYTLFVEIKSQTYYKEMDYLKFFSIRSFVARYNFGEFSDADLSKINSEFNNGMLTIKIPKVKKINNYTKINVI